MNTQTLSKKISLISVLVFGVLSVLLLLPITDNFIEHSKLYTLFFGTLLILILFVIKTYQERAFRISISPVSGALFLFGLATLASTFFTADYPVEGLLGLGGVFIATALIGLFGGNVLPKNSGLTFLKVLAGTSVALTIASVAQMVGYGPSQIFNQLFEIALPNSLNFNLSGAPFIALQVVALTLLAVIFHVVKTKKLSTFFAVTVPILVIGVGIFSWSLLPGKETSLLLPPFSASWSVMLDTIRAPKSALIGAGVANYRNAYQTFKPLWTNGSDQWAVTFTQAANMPLTVLTTMGILGLIAWLILVVSLIRFYKNCLPENKSLGFFVLVSFLLNLVLPFNTVILTLQALALAFLVANEAHRLPLLQMQALNFKMLNKPEKIGAPNKPLNVALYTGTALSLVLIIAAGYLVVRSLQANLLMYQSTKAAASNDIIRVYELQQKAVQLNPFIDVFRRRYSYTSAIIAIALSNKADITEAEKQQVSALLQQSVTEARAATTLDPSESQNWTNLAQIYGNLIGVSEDAVNWTVQSYVSAIERHPTDPLLRLDLAAVFVGQKAYQQALGIYDQAINVKANLPISHYRRGEMLELIQTPDAYREARLSYQRALALLPAGSEDYVAVTTKIEELEKFMKDNNISLEAETEQTNPPTTTGTNSDETETTSDLSAPSITEQNLNNTDTVNPTAEPVELDELDNLEPQITPEPTPDATPVTN